MRRVDLAKKIVAAPTDAERKLLLLNNPRLADARLADEIRNICHASWTSEPTIARSAAAAMRLLSRVNKDNEIKAIACWTQGIAYITRGKFGRAVIVLDEAAIILERAGRVHDAAQTQVAKLLALATLSRYDDAVRTGKRALKIFLNEGDDISAGKIEINLSNIASRLGRHREAEKHSLSARRRFIKAGLTNLQAVAENDLADTYTDLNDFEKADLYYHKAHETAEIASMSVTIAEIEACMGNLAVLRGRYADALRFLEMSRQKYEALGMEPQSAVADLEIADIYAELNLGAEATEIYQRVIPVFKRLGQRTEEARARRNYGRLAFTMGEIAVAKRQLARSLRLYSIEKNVGGQASTMLAQAALALRSDANVKALEILSAAKSTVARSENPRDALTAGWLEGEVLLRSGQKARAAKKLAVVASDARRMDLPDLAVAALNSLGELSIDMGEVTTARKYLKRAIQQIEQLRAPLVSEEFSMSFFASRLEPYENLARLHLESGRIADAFRAIERSRARTILDAINRKRGVEAGGHETRDRLRTELNAYYKRLDRAADGESEALRTAIAIREDGLSKLNRRIASVAGNGAGESHAGAKAIDVKNLIKLLGNKRTLVEYIEFQNKISAFIIGGGKIRFVPDIASTDQIDTALDDLQFQFAAYRYHLAGVSRFGDEMRMRADQCLERLYDLLITPVEAHLSVASVIFSPVGRLHYVPFQALARNGRYLIEQFEISYTPGASVWAAMQARPEKQITKPLLVGFADESIPLAEEEIRRIKAVLPPAKSFVGAKAGVSAFSKAAPTCDLIHIACHGHFRAENPMFSSLHLADGWITVNDVCSRRLEAELVTLSACETGLSRISAGEEILGLARGFLTAGAGSLVVSLWSVNDDAASRLMVTFYTELQRGKSIAASLRTAQLEFIKDGEHAYLWSPFILIGR